MGKIDMRTSPSFFILFFILLSSTFYSQNINENRFNNLPSNLDGISSIYLRSGIKMNLNSNTYATISGAGAETNFTSALGYQYWFSNEWSGKTAIGFFQAKSSADFLNAFTISVVTLQFGFSYYPEYLHLGSVGRVHFGYNMGAYFGNASKASASLHNFGSSTTSETIFGSEPNIGIDFFISKWFKIGPLFSFHLIGDFIELDGQDLNYSGAVFSVKLALLL